MHLTQRLARWRGQDPGLSFKEFELLTLLMWGPGQVYTRRQILDALWAGNFPETSNVIHVHVANPRARLRQQGAYRVLRTVRGLGHTVWA
ncbi:winged helix-turn-helix domain-containing protein [Deinococcus aluminii]|uniref:Response regulator MprA n=1 Tax=Deinococcus aluminii TaxID=1656885 RepID=A0ABP9XF64_9DEIO